MPLSHLPPSQRLWLEALLVLWALFLFGGFLLGPTKNNRRIPRWERIASSLMLVAAGWSWRLFAVDSSIQPFALLIALGVTFGLLGDLFLADIISQNRTKATLGGIGAFAIGHLFYIAAILWLMTRFHLRQQESVWEALIFFWLSATAGWYGIVLRGQPSPSILHWAALPYALLLATTAGLAAGLALQQPLFLSLAAGALLFLLSDLILAGALFNDLSFPLHHDIVWLTYGPGQMLIVFSIGAAMLLGA